MLNRNKKERIRCFAFALVLTSGVAALPQTIERGTDGYELYKNIADSFYNGQNYAAATVNYLRALESDKANKNPRPSKVAAGYANVGDSYLSQGFSSRPCHTSTRRSVSSETLEIL